MKFFRSTLLEHPIWPFYNINFLYIIRTTRIFACTQRSVSHLFVHVNVNTYMRTYVHTHSKQINEYDLLSLLNSCIGTLFLLVFLKHTCTHKNVSMLTLPFTMVMYIISNKGKLLNYIFSSFKFESTILHPIYPFRCR